LFLSATPHNGHSNSFTALLELLDPARFTRGVPFDPADLETVLVHRLKDDLRIALNETFPERIVKPLRIPRGSQGRLKVCPDSPWRGCQHWVRSAGLSAPNARYSFCRSRSARTG
jgi:hypothetical protein